MIETSPYNFTSNTYLDNLKYIYSNEYYKEDCDVIYGYWAVKHNWKFLSPLAILIEFKSW